MGLFEEEIGEGGDAIRDEDLLGEAEDEPGQAEGYVVQAEAVDAAFVELRHELSWVDDGAGDEVGEEGDEDGVSEHALAAGRCPGGDR